MGGLNIETGPREVLKVSPGDRRIAWAIPAAILVVTSVVGFVAGRSTTNTPAAPNSMHADEIEAGRFVLKGSSGSVKAVLETDESGQPRLILAGAHGKTRIVLGVMGTDSDFASLKFDDARGEKRLLLSLAPGGASMNLYDDEGSPALSAVQSTLSGSRNTYLQLQRWPGKSFAQMGVMPDGSPHLELADPGGKVVARLPQGP